MSIKKLWKGGRVWMFIGLLFLIVLPLSFNSCGSDYETPTTTQTPNALISPATLKAWMDAGLVNGTGYDRVVIIDLNATYSAAHIDGARFLDSSRISENRVEGPAVSATEVATGARMDELITELGITRNTTIVFTGSAYTSVCRAYYTFRYWGFPKNRLKVLDGLNGSATVVGNTWRYLHPSNWGTVTAPTAAATTYSVTDNGTLRNDLRVSLSEMIDYAEGRVPNALAIDVRTAGTGSYAGTAGSTGGSFPTTSSTCAAGDCKVFEGHINGAKAMSYTTLYNTDLLFKDSGAVQNLFTDALVGLDSTKTAYIYCRLGYMGAVAFFALDGILGWPVAFYDGSWSQWGLLSGNAAMGGMLASDSPWRTDIASRSEVITYNDPAARAIEVLTYDGTTCSGTIPIGGTLLTATYAPVGCNLDSALYAAPVSDADSGNQIEGDDMDYMKSGAGGGGSGGGGAPGC